MEGGNWKVELQPFEKPSRIIHLVPTRPGFLSREPLSTQAKLNQHYNHNFSSSIETMRNRWHPFSPDYVE